MKRLTAAVFAVSLAMSAGAVTATKEWVQTATNAVLRQAKAYGDSMFLPLAGGTVDGDLTFCQRFGIVFSNDSRSVALALGHNERLAYYVDDMHCGNVATNGVGAAASPAELASVSAAVSNLSNTVNAWQTYWDGDDVRVTVTNYYGQTGMPRLYLEEKMQPDDAHTNTWFKTVWNETTRWDAFLSSYAAVTNDLRQNYADRAWGVYDSSSGAYSPDDMLQISQPTIQIAAGLAWQKTVLMSGSVWVLKATTPATVAGTAANGFIRLLDGDGNTMVEIVKGDKRIVGATATAVEMDGARMRVTYSVSSDSHPTLSLCTDLSDPNWVEEGAAGAAATVSWSGSSGAWVATVTPVGARPQMFARATYETGGSTYLNAAVPIGFSKVVIGGHEYTVTVETVSGKKVMVLQ